MKGSKATPYVGEIFRTAGRETTFVPSLQMVADMADDSVYTALAGGPSHRRFSRWHASGLEDWERGRYREVEFDQAGRRRHLHLADPLDDLVRA